MPQNTHIEMMEAEAERMPQATPYARPDAETIRLNAEEVARRLAWNPCVRKSHVFAARWDAMASALRPLLDHVNGMPRSPSDPHDLRWVRDNMPLLWAEIGNTGNAFKLLRGLPHVRTPKDITVPRAAAVAEAYLYAVRFNFDESSFTAYVTAFQGSTVLKYKELWALIPAMELALLEQIAARGKKLLDSVDSPQNVGTCIRSLREINQAQWKDILEPQIAFDRVLREDPAGAYPLMDFDSRNLYREKLVKIAERSDFTEMEVAHETLTLARSAQQREFDDPRQAARE